MKHAVDCRVTLDDKRLPCVEISEAGRLHADISCTGMHPHLRTSCLLPCNATLNAIPSIQVDTTELYSTRYHGFANVVLFDLLDLYFLHGK